MDTGPLSAQEVVELRSIADRLEQRFLIKVHFESVPETTWELGHAVASKSDFKKLRAYMLLFEREFSKYHLSLLRTIKLRSVVFVKDLSFETQLRSAIPDSKNEILLLDFLAGDHDKTYQRHTIHHDFYHMIEEEMHGSTYWKDPAWNKLNTKGFKYGNGGASTYDQPIVQPTMHPEPGFFSRYSMSGLEEDKAEIFAALFIYSEYAQLEEWSKTDPILRNKAHYMKTFLHRIAPGFTQIYWIDLHTRAGSPVKHKGIGLGGFR